MTISSSPCGLLDGGANGGIGSDTDMRIIEFDPDDQRVNITGISSHLVNDQQLSTFCAVSRSQFRPILLLFHQYTYVPLQS